MLALISVAGLIAIAAITPGPNNLVVMHVAARAGMFRALPAIAMIVLGSIALLALATAGAAAVLEARPALARALTIAGCLYLSWMGVSLFVAREQARPASLPGHPLWMFGFQFINPKAWVMVVTASSALQPSMQPHLALLTLAVLFASITTLCLLLWSLLGARLSRWLDRRACKVWFNRVMGAMLIAFSGLLAI